jgi:hypothetical protein
MGPPLNTFSIRKKLLAIAIRSLRNTTKKVAPQKPEKELLPVGSAVRGIGEWREKKLSRK